MKPAGYTALIARFQLAVIPHWHQSFVSSGSAHRIETAWGGTEETYPAKYWPGDSLGNHLEFALKYDGVNLAILAKLFEVVPQGELLAYIKSKPTGKYTRRLWFLYELLSGQRLPLDDLQSSNYVDLLEPERYFTVDPPRQVSRQRINDNLLGNRDFCPIIRRTAALQTYLEADLPRRCREVVSDYSPLLLRRALSYLYTKETKSSFEIERITPNSTRIERFIALLELAESEDFCEKSRLIELQHRIVDPRFREADYREIQNYVGETVAWQGERIHYVCPRPEDLPALMEGLINANQRMDTGNVPPVIHAAAIAYGFVFLHPFEDGNGRIHRFLIHNILARKRFSPEGLMFPVSASMLKHPDEYDASLEAFSRPLLQLIDYSLDEEGQMNVEHETAPLYAYLDLTQAAEALFRFIEQTIESELTKELSFLARYDQAKAALAEIVDMPDRKIDLFIRFCLQNGGRLSARKRSGFFEFLTDQEVEAMEEVILREYGDDLLEER